MTGHIIDCCSLLNLYTGWRQLNEIRALNWNWYICDAVLSEAEYTREYEADGSIIIVPLDMSAINEDAGLIRVSLTTAAEFEDYVNFATEIDDGEAQALAIAQHQGLRLLTDDHKATTLAQREGIVTTSTPAILQAWARLDVKNELRLAEIVRRITTLARFRPRLDSPYFKWWNDCLQIDKV